MTINVRAEKVAIDLIQPHPSNPRIGDVATIADSLKVNGQYSPIVVWNDTIIAGTHTWKAAKSLGWKEVAITRYEGSERDALKILLADNRTADKATYDNEILLEVLGKVRTLEGTGFDADDVGDLEKGGSGPDSKQPKVKFKVGEYSFSTTEEIYEDWATGLEVPDEALRRLGIPLTSVVTEGR